MRSNTPVTLTHHTTPPPYYCHIHSVHTSIPNAQVSRAGLLVWYGGAAAIRGGQAGGGSHSAGCAVHPTSTPVQPTSITTSSQRLSQPIQEVRAYSAPVKSRSNSKVESGHEWRALRFKQALSVPTQNRKHQPPGLPVQPSTCHFSCTWKKAPHPPSLAFNGHVPGHYASTGIITGIVTDASLTGTSSKQPADSG